MAEIVQTPLTVLHVLTCLFLILVVLLQPGRGGGMGAFTGAGAQQVFGGRGASTVLTKATWIAASVFFASSMTLAYLSSSTGDTLEERSQQPDTEDSAEQAPAKSDDSESK